MFYLCVSIAMIFTTNMLVKEDALVKCYPNIPKLQVPVLMGCIRGKHQLWHFEPMRGSHPCSVV
jgi:hypothetical protein